MQKSETKIRNNELIPIDITLDLVRIRILIYVHRDRIRRETIFSK